VTIMIVFIHKAQAES